VLVAAVVLTTGAFAADGGDPADPGRYVDDRSDGASVIVSLYNAVNRHEYSRAWSYFGEDGAAGRTYEQFVTGYEDTDRVELRLGPESSEGAAGSLYYTVPVAIRAHGADGSVQVFGGCYTLRLAQPAIQEPPFRPLAITEAHLRPAGGSLAAAVPADCGN
jgi:hypothetical protein